MCSDERGWAENPLVYCDGHGCSVAVHQGNIRRCRCVSSGRLDQPVIVAGQRVCGDSRAVVGYVRVCVYVGVGGAA